jgi:uncharacterized membrane protein YecN with MAPEG domain
MLSASYPLVWAVGLVGVIVLAVVVAHYFSPAAKDRRKRRRNYGRVISRTRRPVVMLNVNTKKA